MKTTYHITGADAVRLAERDELTTFCYANLWDDGGPISHGIARQILKEDPSLLYVDVVQHEPSGWWNGSQFVSEMPGYNVADYFNATGMYLGPDENGVEPRWDDDAPAATH